MSRFIEAGIGITEIAPGWEVKLEPIKAFPGVIPGSTAYHEAIHTVAGLLSGSDVHIASRIAGPGYLGKTIYGGFNAIGAIAAHAMGCSGTGYDVAMVVAHGYNPGSLAEAARYKLAGHEEEINGVAALIEAKGTITGAQALEVMYKVKSPTAEVEVKTPWGDRRHFEVKTGRSSRCYIPIEIIDNPKNRTLN